MPTRKAPATIRSIGNNLAEIERLYEVCISGKPSTLEAELKAITKRRRVSDPMAVALRARLLHYKSDVPGAIAALARVLEGPISAATPYIVDFIVPLLFSRGQFEAGDQYIERFGHLFVGPMIGVRASMVTVIAARMGSHEKSREAQIEALRLGRALESPTQAGRVVGRVALAAYSRGDYDEAQDLALESARRLEQVGAHRQAAYPYHLLSSIASDWLNDPDVARVYGERMTLCAKKGGDEVNWRVGLVIQLYCAIMSADERRLDLIQARLKPHRTSEQFSERFGIVLADAIALGWNGAFDRVIPLLLMHQKGASAVSVRALCSALLAIAACATGAHTDARRYARMALHQSSLPSYTESLTDVRHRTSARLVAAAACIIGGDPSRGRRYFTRAFDPDGTFARHMTESGISETVVPSHFRGYARYINAAVQAMQSNAIPCDLTPTELEVLRALSSGRTMIVIADEIGRARKTIERHAGSIYQKLEVSSRAQAVERARALGILPTRQTPERLA